ncbi:hypothetical protein D9M71_628480 [compost metagenome]
MGTEAEWVQCFAAVYGRDAETSGKALVANVDGIGEWKALTGADVDLDQVDNTADLDKPVSDPQKTEFARYLLRSRVTTEVMKVLLALPGIRYTDDMKDIIFDEGRTTPVVP